MDLRAGPSFLNKNRTASDVEAALDSSHRLTGTVLGREPAILNGRFRGTEVFLGRGEKSPQSHEPRPKERAADPVDVFGAASAVAAIVDKPSMRADTLALSILLKQHFEESVNLQISWCAPLTVRAIDGFARLGINDRDSYADGNQNFCGSPVRGIENDGARGNGCHGALENGVTSIRLRLDAIGAAGQEFVYYCRS